MELADPAHASERALVVEAVTTLGAGVRAEQADVLVVVDGAHGLAGGLGEVAHLEEAVFVREPIEGGSGVLSVRQKRKVWADRCYR